MSVLLTHICPVFVSQNIVMRDYFYFILRLFKDALPAVELRSVKFWTWYEPLNVTVN